MNRVLAIASLVVMMATGAQAATVNLMHGADLNHINNPKGTASFHVDGVQGHVTAGNNRNRSTPSISVAWDGIGVRSGYFNNPDLDGRYNEWLEFSFKKAVRLISVTFASVDHNDDWDVFVDGTEVANDSTQNPFRFYGKIGTSFRVLADYAYCKGYCGDNFVIKGFKFEHAPAPVPLPATGLLLIGGLAGLGFMRRRKKFAA